MAQFNPRSPVQPGTPQASARILSRTPVPPRKQGPPPGAPLAAAWVCPRGVFNEDYVYLAMLPVAGRALARFDGTVQSGEILALAVMQECFRFWVDKNLPTCGEPDQVDAAAQIAILIAEQLFESGDVQAAIRDFRGWARSNARPSFFSRIFAAS